MTTLVIHQGDCVKHLAEMSDGSVDSVLCDPPYGLKFFSHNGGFDNIGNATQQKEWHREWVTQAYRVLKPNGVLRAFSSPRTAHHLLAIMIELGFSVSLESWLYVSGRPKTIDVAKSITAYELTGSSYQGKFHELAKGHKRERLDIDDYVNRGKFFTKGHQETLDFELTENGQKWDGWQYGLKPAFEPIICATKGANQ